MGKNNVKAASSQASQTTIQQSNATAEQEQESANATNTTTSETTQSTALSDAGNTDVSTGANDGSSVSNSDIVVETKTEEDIVIPPVQQTVAVVAATEPNKAIVIEEAATPVAENASTLDQLEVILKNVPAAHQIEINRILMYIGRMAPTRPVDQKVALTEQVALYRAIQNIINRQDTYFTQLFTAALFLFKEESDGALGDRYRMRFMDNVILHAGDRKAFANITQMMHILADPASREITLKQVNMERALENGLTEEGRTRVLNYFNV